MTFSRSLIRNALKLGLVVGFDFQVVAYIALRGANKHAKRRSLE